MSRLTSLPLAHLVTTRYRNGLLDPPLGELALLMLVGRIRRIPRRWYPSTACTHNLVSTHRLYTPWCCRSRRAASTVCALWAEHRFMTSCVVSESTPMSRPLTLTRRWSVAAADTTCWSSRRVRPRWSDHQVPALAQTGTDIISWRPTRAGQPAGDGGRAVAVWGPRAALSLAAHVRQAPAPDASSSPALSSASPTPTAQGTTAGDYGARREQGDGPTGTAH
jgi:hypothetical protein